MVLGYYLLMLLQACCSCQDPELPYFDYKAIIVETQGPDTSSPTQRFSFIISLDSTVYVALQQPLRPKPAGLIHTAYACDCAGNGAAGTKFGIREINIFADSVFDASIPADQPLNQHFEATVAYNSTTGTYDPVQLDSIRYYTHYFKNASHLKLVSQAVPVNMNRPYRFKVEIVKENGFKVSANSSDISWSN